MWTSGARATLTEPDRLSRNLLEFSQRVSFFVQIAILQLGCCPPTPHPHPTSLLEYWPVSWYLLYIPDAVLGDTALAMARMDEESAAVSCRCFRTVWVKGGKSIFQNVVFRSNYSDNPAEACLMYETSVCCANSYLEEEMLTQVDTVSKNNCRVWLFFFHLPTCMLQLSDTLCKLDRTVVQKVTDFVNLAICLQHFSTALL